ELTPGLARHLDLCLGCRACETACPSGVPFGQLLEATRAQLDRKRVRARESAHATLEWALSIFPHPDRLGALLWPLRLYQASGLRALVRASGILAPFKRLQAMDALLPRVLPGASSLPELIPARGRARGRAALLTGCVSALKEYGRWLGDEGAERFAGLVKDISEVLVDADLPLGELRETVTYHDACHLAHGQKVRAQPRELLRRIPGVTLVELTDSD